MRTKHTLNPCKSLLEADKDTQLFHFLQAVPYLDFSDKGYINISKRFGLTVEQLKQKIAEYEKGGRNNEY